MHLLPRFDYIEPQSLTEACTVLSEMNGEAKIVAGGTDVLVNMKKGLMSPRCLVSLRQISELAEVKPLPSGVLIGSHVIVARLTESDVLRLRYPMLGQASSVLGSPLVRNRATIGGNIVNARPAADLPPPLVAMGARVHLRGMNGEREIDIDDFLVGPGQTLIRTDEIVTAIAIDEPLPFTGGQYLKLMHRRSLEIAIVAVAVRLRLDGPGGPIIGAAVVLSSVAPRAIHAPVAEALLIGEKPSKKLFEKAASAASGECSPIDDLRGGAEYRCAMVEVLTKRALTAAAKEASVAGEKE